MKQAARLALLLPLLLGLLASLYPSYARAVVVYDPSNYAQNVLSAARALEQIRNQISSLQNEAIMLQNMARNLQRLDFSSAARLTSALSSIHALMGQANTLSYDVSRLDAQWRQAYPSSYEDNVLTSTLAQDAQKRWQTSMASYAQTMQVEAQIIRNLQEDQSLLNDLLSHSQSAQGTLQAQQTGNELLALMAKQLFQTQMLLAAHFRAQEHDAARAGQAEEAARATAKHFLGTDTAYPEGAP